jgi:hypothetical protein
MTGELPDLAIATAGGRELWNTVRGLKVDLSIGGPIWASKGWPTGRTFDQVNGSALVGHYTSRHRSFDGLLVATRRRVFRRNPDNSVNLNLPSITLDIHHVELVRSAPEEAQP